MEIWQIALIGVGFFIFLAVIARRYMSGVVRDALDAGLSFADEFFGGFFGFDWGDLIAAIIIFVKERKITNGWVAFIIAWEALNFLPLGLIPPVEYFFNFFPAVTISRFLFNKFGKADKAVLKLESDIEIAKRIGVDVDDKKLLEEVKKLIKSEDPIDALKKAKKADSEIGDKLIKYVDNVMSETQAMIDNVVREKPDGPEEMINMLQAAIAETKSLLMQAQDAREKGDFSRAVMAASEAKNVLQAGFSNCKAYMQGAA